MPSQDQDYRIEALTKTHTRTEFTCGKEALDRYIQHQARQDAEKHVAAPFVLVAPPSKKVQGYYTLSSSAVDLHNLPPDLVKKLPRYPHMPVILLVRLAVDLSLKGRGQGEFLLMDALSRGVGMSQGKLAPWPFWWTPRTLGLRSSTNILVLFPCSHSQCDFFSLCKQSNCCFQKLTKHPGKRLTSGVEKTRRALQLAGLPVVAAKGGASTV